MKTKVLPFGLRTIQIYRRDERNGIEIMATFRSMTLASALGEFEREYLERLGYTDSLRTGNVLGVYDREGKYLEFFARDKVLG